MNKQRKKPGRKPTGLPHKNRINISISETAQKKLRELANRETNGSASAWIEKQIFLTSI